MPDVQPLAHPHLRALLADAEATHAETERLRDTLTGAQLTWHPGPGVWSVADCFEHLRKTDRAYCPRIAEALERTEPGEAPFRPSWFGKRFLRFISPDSSFRLKAPKAARPKETPPSAGADALDRFLDQQAEVMDLLHRADGRDLNGGKFPSPLAGIVRFSVGEGLTLLVLHGQRHLGQALRLTERPDFPS